MRQSSNTDRVNVQIGGDVSGQIAIGNNILQIGDVHGGIVNIIQPDKKPTFTERPRPVFVRPRPFPGFLNRDQEMDVTVEALRMKTPVSVYGENGFGKTALLRQLAYNAPESSSPHGIVYFPVRGQPVDDLLQTIFDYFYQSDSTAKPGNAELRQFLQNIQALILLDDVQLSYDAIMELVNAVPQCVFILASPERCLWGEGCCVELRGLPVEEALTLIERELGRNLTPEERASAEELCQVVNGQPLFLLQAASLVREGRPFEEINAEFRVSEEKVGVAVFEKLTDSQRDILGLLSVLKNIPVPTRHLAALTGADDIDAQLKTLLNLRLVQAHSPAYSLTGSLALPVGQLTIAADWESRSLKYFSSWLRQNPPLPDVTDALDLILSLLERANQDGRWDEVISLGRGVEKALILTKRWQAWRQVLEWLLNAAKALGDQALQGWTLHQLGTRSLCLGDLATARQSLTQALGIREALGDKGGAAVTRHNLELLAAPPAPPRDKPRSKPRRAPGKGSPPMLKAIFTLISLAVIGVVLVLVWVYVINPPTPPPDVLPTPLPATSRTVTKIPAQPVPPTDEPVTQSCGPGVWYCEDFQDNAAQNWELSPSWSIQRDGSNYVLAGSGHQWASLTDKEWDDYRVAFRLRLLEGTIHLNYRIRPDPSSGIVRYFVGFHQDGLYLDKSGPGGSTSELTTTQTRHSLGNWHTVEIAAWGGHLAVFVDGRLELQYVDDDYLRGGSIAFETLDDGSAQIDDIEVTAPGDEPGIANEPPVRTQSCHMTTEEGFDRPGMDLTSINLGLDGPPLWEACAAECYAMPGCRAYTANNETADCWLKFGQPDQVTLPYVTSGIKVCE